MKQMAQNQANLDTSIKGSSLIGMKPDLFLENKPGKYHGYIIDQKLGGTYNVNKGIDIIENLKKYSKFRKFISEMQPK